MAQTGMVRRVRWRAGWLAVLVAGAALVGACSSGGGDDASPAPSDEGVTTTEARGDGDEDVDGADEGEEPTDAESEDEEANEQDEETFAETAPDDGRDEVLIDDLVVGHCIEEDVSFLFDAVATFTLLDCAQPHRAEKFFEFDVLDGPYPGEQVLGDLGDERCFGAAFSDYVGTSWDASSVYGSSFYPTSEAWDAGDRTISCFLHEEDPSTLITVSYRNSGR
jgi:hypothetical protein